MTEAPGTAFRARAVVRRKAALLLCHLENRQAFRDAGSTPRAYGERAARFACVEGSSHELVEGDGQIPDPLAGVVENRVRGGMAALITLAVGLIRTA